MIRLAIVEDEEDYIQCLQDYIERYRQERSEEFEISVFRDGEDLVDNYKEGFDIIFMDIQMQFMDGMRAAEEVRKKDNCVVIIFITNMVQYAIKGYAVNALDYVLKPMEYFTFSQKLDKAAEFIRNNRNRYVLIPVKNGVQKLNISHIYYVESQGHMLHYHTGQDIYISRGNMSEVEEVLQPYGFFRSNKGYLVSLRYVEAVKDNCCVVNGEMLIIARTRRKEFKEALADYISEVIS